MTAAGTSTTGTALSRLPEGKVAAEALGVSQAVELGLGLGLGSRNGVGDGRTLPVSARLARRAGHLAAVVGDGRRDGNGRVRRGRLDGRVLGDHLGCLG